MAGDVEELDGIPVPSEGSVEGIMGRVLGPQELVVKATQPSLAAFPRPSTFPESRPAVEQLMPKNSCHLIA